jgi:hypothetical protein
MRITDEEQNHTDFDWFCVDRDGSIGHFASAGFKSIPPSVSESAEDLQFLIDFFAQLNARSEGHTVDALLPAEKRKERFLRSFTSMANRGLYSFDVESYLKPDSCYYRVAIPNAPIRFHELPEAVRSILGRTVLKGRLLVQTTAIPYSETLLF